MKQGLAIAVLLVALGGCAEYSLVRVERQTIGGTYTVDPQIQWNKTKAGKSELWTVDGPALEQLRLYSGIGEGDTLFDVRSKDKKKLPNFRTDMKSIEVVEFVVDSLARIGLNEVEASNLRPVNFGSQPGFRFELTFFSTDGLEMEGLAAGAVLDGKLQMILFTGAKSYYFPKYKGQVERIVDSVEST